MGEWRVWHGPATHQEVDVFVQWTPSTRSKTTSGPINARVTPPDDIQWSIRGPQCVVSRTLPASFRFRREAPDLWRSTIVDPCFWSPDFPARYQLTASGPASGPASATISASPTCRLEMAVRQWGVRDARFWLNGHRWVWRAASWRTHRDTRPGREEPFDPAPWQETLMSQVVEFDELLTEAGTQRVKVASKHGIALAVRLRDATALDRLSFEAHAPALLFAILPADAPVTRAQVRAAAPNLLFLAEFADPAAPAAIASEGTAGRPDWCDGVIGPACPEWLAGFRARYPGLPLVACRNAGEMPDLALREANGEVEVASLRRACERLQAELLSVGYLDGYVVECSP